MKNNLLASGNEKLVSIISNFKAGELIAIGSRPCMGKTWLALTIAAYMAFDKSKLVTFFSLEIAKDILLKRINKIGNFEDESIHNSPFYILDTPNITIQEIEQHIRVLQSKKIIEAVFIDYLGLLCNGNTLTERKKEQADLFIELKNLSIELNIPIITTFQLPRDNENLSLQTIQLRYSSDEAFKCIDKLILIQMSDAKKTKLNIYKRSQENNGASEEIQWILPV